MGSRLAPGAIRSYGKLMQHQPAGADLAVASGLRSSEAFSPRRAPETCRCLSRVRPYVRQGAGKQPVLSKCDRVLLVDLFLGDLFLLPKSGYGANTCLQMDPYSCFVMRSIEEDWMVVSDLYCICSTIYLGAAD